MARSGSEIVPTPELQPWDCTIMTYNDDGKYEGEFRDGKRHGKGVVIYPNGDKYDGEWEAGKKSGKGVVIYPNGNKYDEEWKDGKRHKGVETYSNGNKYLPFKKFGRILTHFDGTVS